MSTILISGSIAYDTIMNFHDSFTKYIMPQHIHSLSVNFNINEMVRYAGGTAQNIGYAAYQCSQPAVLVSSVGIDFEIPSQCAGMNYDQVKKSETLLTAVATIITDENNNQITAFYPGSSGESLESSLKDIAHGISYAIVSPNNPMTMYRHVHDLAEMNVPFFFDPGQPLSAFSKEQLHQIMKVTPYLIVNEYEKDLFCKIAGIGFDDLIMGFEKVLVTLGSQGVELWTGPDLQKYQANHVANVVDPTGAGDALRGGLLAGLAQGMSRSEAIDQGQRLASLCIQKKGTIERSL